MAFRVNNFQYIYNSTIDYQISIQRRRTSNVIWTVNQIGWTYTPVVITDKGWGRTRTLAVDHVVTGVLTLNPWNLLPGLQDVFYVDDTYFQVESDALYDGSGVYIDRGFGTFYVDNYLRIIIDRWQGGVLGANTIPYDRVILDRVRFLSFNENVRLNEVPPVEIRFIAHARPYQDFALQLSANQLGPII